MSLSERLREIANGRYHTSVSDDLSEAAASLDHQAAEIERLRASLDEAAGVLRPFGAFADALEPSPDDPEAEFFDTVADDIQLDYGIAAAGDGRDITYGNFRAARDFITKHGGERE